MYLDEKNQQKILSLKNSYIAVMIVRGSQNAFWQTHILATAFITYTSITLKTNGLLFNKGASHDAK